MPTVATAKTRTLAKEYNLIIKRDPSKTAGLRRAFAAKMKAYIKAIAEDMHTSIVKNDCFGIIAENTEQHAMPFRLRANIPLEHNAFAFRSSADKVNGFMDWLRQQQAEGILRFEVRQAAETGRFAATHIPLFDDMRPVPWTNVYIQSSYQEGMLQAGRELRAKGIPGTDWTQSTQGIEMHMLGPVHADRAGALYSRVFNDLETVMAYSNADIQRELTDGLTQELTKGIVDGLNPRTIARQMSAELRGRLDAVAKNRSVMIARTEVMRAHHVAKMAEYRQGVEELPEDIELKVEWILGTDPCEHCIEWAEQGPYDLDKIEGEQPLHPHCVCSSAPVLMRDGQEISKLPKDHDIDDEGAIIETPEAVKGADTEIPRVTADTDPSDIPTADDFLKAINDIENAPVDTAQLPSVERQAVAIPETGVDAARNAWVQHVIDMQRQGLLEEGTADWLVPFMRQAKLRGPSWEATRMTRAADTRVRMIKAPEIFRNWGAPGTSEAQVKYRTLREAVLEASRKPQATAATRATTSRKAAKSAAKAVATGQSETAAMRESLMALGPRERQRAIFMQMYGNEKTAVPTIRFTGPVSSTTKARAKDAAEWVGKVVRSERYGNTRLNVVSQEARTRAAFKINRAVTKTGRLATPKSAGSHMVEGSVLIGRSEASKILVHELGHGIEHMGTARREAMFRLFEKWTRGHKRVSLKTINRGYRAEEYSFVKAVNRRLTGHYWAKDIITAQGNRGATEFMSMGLQYFYDSPVTFARHEPELFNALMRILKMGD